MNYSKSTIPPSQLWIGPHEQLVEEVKDFLQRILCPNNSCKNCTICTNISAKQHHAILWLYPEKQYTLDSLDEMFSSLSFQLHQNEIKFFIIQKADFLTPLCANKLLKPMEEPPQGYHFILLAHQIESILPTVRSRCVIRLFNKKNSAIQPHALVAAFTNNPISPAEFSKLTDQMTINERESVELLDEIIAYWSAVYKNNINTNINDPAMDQIMKALLTSSSFLPMPGSHKIFWRNLYISVADQLESTQKTSTY